jgi:hypothetical protein
MTRAPQITLRYAFLALFLVGSALISPGSHEAKQEWQEAGIPCGYVDTVASGQMRAALDIERGIPKWGVRGLPAKNFVSLLLEAGVSPVFFSCLRSEDGEEFWYGYNKYVFDKLNLKKTIDDSRLL